MTEDEARTKLCHVSIRMLPAQLELPLEDRKPPEGIPPGHRGPVHGANCIASDCMAWRLSHTAGDDGFCGLAGGTDKPSYGYPPGSGQPTEPTPS